MNLKLIIFLWLTILGVSFNGHAQDVAAKLMSFNEAIGKTYNVSNKGKILIVEGFREGKQLKNEKVNVFDLDVNTLKYSEADGTVSINCFSDLDGCVEQKLLLDKKKDYRKRLVFGLSEGVNSDEIITKLGAVIDDMMKSY